MRLFPGFRALTMSALAFVCAQLTAGAQTQTSFSAHTIYNSADQLKIMAHGDFNGDGREDLIVDDLPTTGTGGSTYLFLSNGDGTYDSPIQLTTPPRQQIIVGDFNGDGKLDYAALDVDGQVVNVWVGHGDGTFTNTVQLSTPGVPVAMAAADMNHDNITDVIVVGNMSGNHVIQVWMMNNYGTGETATSVNSEVISPTYIGTGDFDGDGKPDVVVESQPTGQPTTVQVWYGDGKGNLGSQTQLTDTSGTADYWDPSEIGDVDNNGTSDLMMARMNYMAGGGSTYLPQIAIFKGNTNRTLSLMTVNTAKGCPGVLQIQTADVNGDGLNDLVYTEAPCNAAGTTNVVVNPATAKGVFSGNEQSVYSTAYASQEPLELVKSTQGTKPDVIFTPFTADFTNGTPPSALVLLENTTSGSSFPACGTTDQAFGINLCAPNGASANSPVNFSISAAGPTPMRTVAVWADGQKVSEQLTHAFSNYSFLDQSVTLSAGSHNITIYGTGWDNTLQSKSFTVDVGGVAGCGAPSSPGVNVCQPANGSTVGSQVEVQAAANIVGTLARMEIWVDGTKMFTETTSTNFDTTVALANGYHRFDIYAVNTAGTKYETTVYATVGTSNGCAAPSSPGVNVCSPANQSTVHSPVQVTATANIVGTLARMEIWVSGGKMYTERTSTQLNTTLNLGAGKYQFDIYAVNTQGAKYETTVYATVQ